MLSKTQERILIFLADRVDARSRDITEALDIALVTFQRSIPDLYDQDYLQRTSIPNSVVIRYSLTEDGLSVAKRLIRYQATEGQIVQPARINKLAGKYEPTYGYQRNQGHPEILSRGF